jgi:hypothetical protein
MVLSGPNCLHWRKTEVRAHCSWPKLTSSSWHRAYNSTELLPIRLMPAVAAQGYKRAAHEARGDFRVLQRSRLKELDGDLLVELQVMGCHDDAPSVAYGSGHRGSRSVKRYTFDLRTNADSNAISP